MAKAKPLTGSPKPKDTEPKEQEEQSATPAVPTVPIVPGVAPATSLIKSNLPNPSLSQGLTLPGFLRKVPLPPTSNRQLTGYVGFASTQSKRWGQQQASGLVEGQPFIFHNNAYIRLERLEFFLCIGESFQTMMSGRAGTFIFATRDMTMQLEPVVHKGNLVKLEPHYVCLLLVNLNGTLVPIKGDFRGTKSGGIENAIRAVEAASNPDWLKLSEAHRITAAFPEAWGRVYNTITTKRGVSQENGNSYYAAQCQPSPAPLAQMELLVNALKDEAFMNVLTEAHTNFGQRIKFLVNIIENPPSQQQQESSSQQEASNPDNGDNPF